jgi:hypothetical protein
MPPPARRMHAVCTREVLPAATRDEDDRGWRRWSAGRRRAVVPCGQGREERLNEGPLPVGEMNPVHAGMVGHLSSVFVPPLEI